MKAVKAIAIVLLLIVGGLIGCSAQQQSQPTEEPSPEQSYPYEHFTIYPQDNEASFELKPYDCYSVIVYLEENQIMEVDYILTPSDLATTIIKVKYTCPEGYDIAVATTGQIQRRSFETQPHGEGYYSIDFYYDVPEGIPVSMLANIKVHVRYDIQ